MLYSAVFSIKVANNISNQMNKIIRLTQSIQKKLPEKIMSPAITKNYCQANAGVKLPHLPVPPLNKTIEKFLQSAKPFLNKDEFTESQKVAKEFENGVGKELQQLLEQKASKTENWLLDWWLDSAYLGFRETVVLFSSPGQIFPRQQFSKEEDRLKFTAKLIYAAMQFKKNIDNNKIPPEKSGKDFLDMAQYKKVYGTCRIPGLPKDSLRYNPDSKYIIIACNNNYYSMPVYNKTEIIDENAIETQLTKIIQDSTTAGVPIGALSADGRDSWAKSYKHLISLGNNANSIKTIQNCLFLVCLDKTIEKKQGQNELTQAGHQLLHGGGSTRNIGNRFFDKTIQFVISPDGVAGMSYEHSPAEGQPIAILTDYIMDFITKNMKADGKVSAAEQFTKVEFTADDTLNQHIENAYAKVDDLVKNFDLVNFTFTGYGKDFIKTQKMSPDSYIQMAIQATYYSLHNAPASHYESAATRKYIHGRTETIRSCSVESVDFAKKLISDSVTSADKAAALVNAVNSHKRYSVDAANGFGVDRHFLGLRLIAEENNISIPNFFEDAAFVKSRPVTISTSQVASRCDGMMCYGPIITKGYACCYNPRTKTINFGVSSFHDCENTSSIKFHDNLIETLKKMQEVLISSPKAKL